jgi:glucose/arabinose dehydrogenase
VRRSARHRLLAHAAVVVVLGLLAAGCPADEPPPAAPERETTPPPAEAEDTPEPDPPPDEPDEPDEVTIDEVSLALEPVAEGFEQPIDVTAPPGDDRLYVAERPGRVWILDGGDRELFLDITDRTVARGEQGLLGIAFHPDFADSGRFVVHHTDTEGDTRLAEYRADGDSADPGSRRELLQVPQPAANHNGGMVAFGPDGMLYLGLGDGGGGGDTYGQGQRADTLLGTILRLDPDGGAAAGNPFTDDDAGADEVWHYGLRNPWRFAFDFDEELLYIADVGQDRYEEVNVVPAGDAGLNFGWPIMEAGHCFEPREGCATEGLVGPVLEYEISGGPCAIIGGFVYRGDAIAGLDGHYLYSDYCAGFVRSFRHDGGQAVDERDWTEQTGRVSTPYSFGRDGAGELYITETESGRVLKLVPGD